MLQPAPYEMGRRGMEYDRVGKGRGKGIIKDCSVVPGQGGGQSLLGDRKEE